MLKTTLSSTFSDDSEFRVNIGMSGVDSSQVMAVTDSLVCTRVTEIIDSATKSPPPTTSAFVLRAGPLFFGFAHIQANPSLFIVDTSYRFQGVIPP
jgi:hypothetical protein